MTKKTEWQKEKHEHPWASKATAKRIARDHAKQKQHSHKHGSHAGFNLHAAHSDLTGMTGGAKAIASQMHREVH